jgi:hypothetical protein
MPGFNISGEEGGNPPSNTLETARSHRWAIPLLGPIQTSTKPILAKEFSLPDINFEVQEIMGGFATYKFAKSFKVGQFSITFYETLDTYKRLRKQWHDLVGTIRDGIKPHNDYKKSVIVTLLDGEGSPIYAISFEGAWPKTLELGELSYETTDIKLITMQCEFDFLEVIEASAIR